MAAFTTFSQEALERYLIMFDLGELVSFAPITTGIENSNYFVTIARGGEAWEYVLTITEGLAFDQVPFFNEVFQLLDRSKLPVPNPVKTLDGMGSTIFCGKPAWLFPKLPGHHPVVVSAHQCRIIGNALARLHEAARSARYTRANPYDLAFLQRTLRGQQHRITPPDAALCEQIIADYLTLLGSSGLPRGIIHGDLFRDNTMFENDVLTGIIDFYHACDDFLVQDIAITLNDWATDPDGFLIEDRACALLAGYEEVRKLSNEEQDAMPVLRRAGALRFILTRLLSGDDGATLKDPAEFIRIARAVSVSKGRTG